MIYQIPAGCANILIQGNKADSSSTNHHIGIEGAISTRICDNKMTGYNTSMIWNQSTSADSASIVLQSNVAIALRRKWMWEQCYDPSGKNPAAACIGMTANETISNLTTTNVNFNDDDHATDHCFNVDSRFDTTNHYYLVFEDGIYLVTANVTWVTPPSGCRLDLYFYKGATNYSGRYSLMSHPMQMRIFGDWIITH